MIALNTIFAEFVNHPQAWTRVDAILTQSNSPYAKNYGLVVLERLIDHRWNSLPKDQQKAIRDFMVDNIIKVSSSEQSKQSQGVLLRKMNAVLVKVRF